VGWEYVSGDYIELANNVCWPFICVHEWLYAPKGI
jgi:hypothetical protein